MSHSGWWVVGDHVTRLAGGCGTQGPLQPVITHLTNGPKITAAPFITTNMSQPAATRAAPGPSTGARVVCFYEVWMVESVKQAA